MPCKPISMRIAGHPYFLSFRWKSESSVLFLIKPKATGFRVKHGMTVHSGFYNPLVAPSGLAPRSLWNSGHLADMTFTVNAADARWRGLFEDWKSEFHSHHVDEALRPKEKSGSGVAFSLVSFFWLSKRKKLASRARATSYEHLQLYR